MNQNIRVGYAFCGSFCTMDRAIGALEKMKGEGCDLYPVVSEALSATDTRFGAAHDFMREIERICGRRVIASITEAEPIGPRKLLDVMVVAPCTGNTLAKLAGGITTGTVPLAVKAHLRNGRPVVLAVATNDGLAASAGNISALLARKHYYFVPFRQDDPEGKPTSLVADFSLLPRTVEAALAGRQLQPLLLCPGTGGKG